jgi:predicted lysophospholipase L1 biosynthesis ABC-type transport system permease subunit
MVESAEWEPCHTPSQGVTQLVPFLPAGAVSVAGNNVKGWTYRPTATADTFDASLRLGWDPSLVYHGTATAGTWAFEPGDGSPERPVILHP